MDNSKQANEGAKSAYRLWELIEEKGKLWEDEMDNILQAFYTETNKELLHTILYY